MIYAIAILVTIVLFVIGYFILRNVLPNPRGNEGFGVPSSATSSETIDWGWGIPFLGGGANSGEEGSGGGDDLGN